MSNILRHLVLCLLPIVLCACGVAGKQPLHVAVASNFQPAFEELSIQFSSATGMAVQASYGATGKLDAQIRNGAPFDVFLAADADHPRALVSDGVGESTRHFTYAVGRLALISKETLAPREIQQRLMKGEFEHLAVAKPELAPYGKAAMETLDRLSLLEAVKEKLVYGENISQACQFVQSGAAELGLVAVGQVVAGISGSYWEVPEELHEPILQDAVQLNSAGDPAAAGAFLEFLRGAEAGAIIRRFGYAIPRGMH